jgi:hypothetical protein
MKRFLEFFAVLLTLLLPAAAQAGDKVTVVNVHAWDCPPCIQWQNKYKKDWIASRAFRQVRYVEIDSPTIRQAYDASLWPQDLRPLLKEVFAGVPRYLIVKDGRIVSNQYGVDHWPLLLADLPKFVAAAPAAAGDGAGRYDGAWAVSQTCADHNGAKGYTIKYDMTVSNGRVLAQRGTEGKPDSMTLTGQIAADGSAALSVKGLTGSAAYNLGSAKEGVPFGYPVTARFSASRGSGERTQDRPCKFTFSKE